MATYIWRGPWTTKGMEKINDLPQRYEMTQNAFKSAGAELKDLYITMGTDDWTGIVEAPSEETMMKALLTIAGADWQNRKQCPRCISQRHSVLSKSLTSGRGVRLLFAAEQDIA
jgi:uncharacterized protein with GYD domain